MNKSSGFCYIAPTSLLDTVTASKTHLVLAHLVATDPEYAKFYRELSDDNYVMMDNSAYELKEPYNVSQLQDLALACGAHAIVLPDYPFQPAQKTIDAALEFAPQFKKSGFHTFFVPQSQKGDWADWRRAYDFATRDASIDIIGMSILGIPNALPAFDPSVARIAAVAMLGSEGALAKKHHHFLGLNSGPALEIPSLRRYLTQNNVPRFTIDSSGPVWSAILGHEYTTNCDTYLPVKKPLIPVQFDLKRPKDKATIERIRYNIWLTEKLFTNNDASVWYAQE